MYRAVLGGLAVLFLATGSAAGADEAPTTRNGLFPDEIISCKALEREMESSLGPLLLDARDKRSYDTLHLKGARLPLSESYYREMDLFKNGIIAKAPDHEKALDEAVKDLPRDRSIVTYCNSGCHAGSVLALRLKQRGLANVRALDEGLQACRSQGLPTESSEKAS